MRHPVFMINCGDWNYDFLYENGSYPVHGECLWHKLVMLCPKLVSDQKTFQSITAYRL